MPDQLDQLESQCLEGEQRSMTEATTDSDAFRAFRSAIRDAAKETTDAAAAFDGIEGALPSDRSELRGRATNAARNAGVGHYGNAQAAIAVLEAEARIAALPPEPRGRDRAAVVDELRMMLDSKLTKEHVLQLAAEDRYAGLLAGPWGNAYLRSKGNGGYHDAIVAAVLPNGWDAKVKAARQALAYSQSNNRRRLAKAGHQS